MTTTELFVSYEAIVGFVEMLKLIHKELESTSFNDCLNILKMFDCNPVKHTLDSGFESEDPQVANCTSTSSQYFPSSMIKELIFESNNIDSILENGLITICQYIVKLLENFEENNSKIESVLAFLSDFVDFLRHINSNAPYIDIISVFFDALFAGAMTEHDDTQFNLIMDIFLRFSEQEILRNIILVNIIKNIGIFTDNLELEDILEVPNFFHYESDLSRVNSLFLTLLLVHRRNSCENSENIEKDICSILENFVGYDDYFNLMFLGHHTFFT